jgi:hypothetical protein
MVPNSPLINQRTFFFKKKKPFLDQQVHQVLLTWHSGKTTTAPDTL